mmetsp:Transcript_25708/g.59286  ORF Transcript_25708/g.59286 Transcript_25708/m.59286 type:complete len:195 (-) Transcript_25708:175-759(-)
MYRAEGKHTAVVTGGRKKIHSTWPDGMEMVQEYDTTTDLLVHRRVRTKTRLGGIAPWVIEVGEAERPAGGADLLLAESSDNPILMRKDTKEAFQWRIRNLPYPADVYSVTVNPEEKKLVVRTSNKKYFKKIDIPDMEQALQPFEQEAVSFNHANRTLVISYRKPQPILEAEKAWKVERNKMKIAKEGDVECPQQ